MIILENKIQTYVENKRPNPVGKPKTLELKDTQEVSVATSGSVFVCVHACVRKQSVFVCVCVCVCVRVCVFSGLQPPTPRF
jgi:hypothetical protein